MDKKLIVTISDKSFLNASKQFFSSLLINSPGEFDLMLLSVDIEPDELLWFRRANVLIKEVMPVFSDVEWKNLISSSCNLSNIMSVKFYLFTDYFKRWKKIIYMDSDIIIRGDVSDLFDVKTYAAVQDVFAPKLYHQVALDFKNINSENKFKKLGKDINYNKQAFNAGVFSFDTSIIKETTFNDLKNLMINYGKISAFADQLVFNLYFYEKWEKKSLLYNFNVNHFNYFIKIKPEFFCGYVLHFTGDKKPWNPENLFYGEWKYYFERADEIADHKRYDEQRKFLPIKLTNKFFLGIQNLIICKATCFVKVKKNLLIKILIEILKVQIRVGQFLHLFVLRNLIKSYFLKNRKVLRTVNDFFAEVKCLIKYDLSKIKYDKNTCVKEYFKNKDLVFFYCSCNNHFQYLMLSLQSLESLPSEKNKKVFIYCDPKDFFTPDNIEQLNSIKGLNIKVRSARYSLNWGGVRLIVNQMVALEEISANLGNETFIVKVDSDILFISNKIMNDLKKSSSGMIGNPFVGAPMRGGLTYKYIQGGCYFLRADIASEITRMRISKYILSVAKKTILPFFHCPEDAFFFDIVKSIGGNIEFENYYFPLPKLDQIDKYSRFQHSVIHFENNSKNKMKKMKEIIFSKNTK